MRQGEWKALEEAAREQGWEVEQTRGNHRKFIPPAGNDAPYIFSSGTPSDYRAVKNCRAKLRRAGVRI